MGDPGFDVILANTTDQHLTIVVTGAGPEAMTLALAPHEERPKTWFYPDREADSRTVTVKAAGDSGTTIFCKIYGYNAIRDATYRIEIRADVITC